MAGKLKPKKLNFKDALDSALNVNEEIATLSNSFSKSLNSSKRKADLRKKLENTGRSVALILQKIISIKQDIED